MGLGESCPRYHECERRLLVHEEPYLSPVWFDFDSVGRRYYDVPATVNRTNRPTRSGLARVVVLSRRVPRAVVTAV